jgi:hypothetical protein
MKAQAMNNRADIPRTRQIDSVAAKAAFARGENATRYVRKQLGVDYNTPEIAEMANDLSAQAPR